MSKTSNAILAAFLSSACFISIGTGSAQGFETASLLDRLRDRASEAADQLNQAVEALDAETIDKVKNALLLGVDYGDQARRDEEAGYRYAHEKAAYDWGYEVGDPIIVRSVRLYWEGVQLGIFAIGDVQQLRGGKTENWAMLESMIGGNGEEYDVDQAYINDIFYDVSIAEAGAIAAQSGEESDFEGFIESR